MANVNLDFFMVVAGSVAMPLPGPVSAVTYNSLREHEVDFNIMGQPIIRRTSRTYHPTEIIISGSVLSTPQLYKKEVVKSGGGDAIEGAGISIISDVFGAGSFFGDLYSSEEVVNAFSDLYKRSIEQGFKLSFYDLQRQQAFHDAEVISFVLERSTTSNKFGYRYTLTLKSYTQKVSDISRYSEWLSSVTGVVRSVNAGIATLTQSVNDIKDLVFGPINDLVREVSRVGEQLDQLVVATAGFGYQAKLTASNAISAGLNVARLGGSLNEVNRLWDVLSDTSTWIPQHALLEFYSAWGISQGNARGGGSEVATSSSELSILSALDEVAYQAQVLLGYVGFPSTIIPSFEDTGSFLDTSSGRLSLARFSTGGGGSPSADEATSSYSLYTLRMGESLFDVARSVFGDASRWTEIARLNQWASAYEKSDGTFACAGDKIKIPSTDTLLSGVPILNQGDPMLTDLRLSADGDLSFNGDDLALISGMDNFTQAMANRLKTKKGELSYIPSYGMYDLIGGNISDFAVGLLSTDITNQVLSDERVVSVTGVNVISSIDQIDVKMSVTPTTLATTDLIIPVI